MGTAQETIYYDDCDISPEESDATYKAEMKSSHRSSVTTGHRSRFNHRGRVLGF